ncbi:hypothetical protein KVH22_25320 [Streptomyces olivaceus]|uniref:hypothetical protein n=1 Tax=Streptomyces olivaceus TaxID=47716 RepID=UPI001CC9C060|nr:hypothetical protein [Streptomyces olivaceus]MBZ6258839.1 hypothetical protein [Streptomyces olivaceus]
MTAHLPAAIVAAGTAAVLAPVDPTLFRQVAAPAPAAVPGFTALLLAHAHLRAQAETAAKVRAHFGWRHWTPNAHVGETATTPIVWDQHELSALYERVGGTVTTRQAERTISDDTTWTATEITLTTAVPDVGTVTVSTDFDEESGGHDLPVMRAARAAAVEPLGDLVSGDALHTNPAAHRVRTWMTVNAAEQLAAGADDRASRITAVTAPTCCRRPMRRDSLWWVCRKCKAAYDAGSQAVAR